MAIVLKLNPEIAGIALDATLEATRVELLVIGAKPVINPGHLIVWRQQA
jgi:hypothetical protein